jgi:hypothetical protein
MRTKRQMGCQVQKCKNSTARRIQKTGNAVAPLRTGTESTTWRVSPGRFVNRVAQVTARLFIAGAQRSIPLLRSQGLTYELMTGPTGTRSHA